VARPIGRHDLWVLLPPGFGPAADPLPVGELDGWAVVDTLTGFSAVRAAVLRLLARSGVRLRPAVRTRHLEALAPLVAAGVGVAFSSEGHAREAASAGVTVRRLEPCLSAEVVLLHRPGGLSPAARGFVTVLHEELGLAPFSEPDL
jgi:DNA-binding transcriptional LysR family regulator